MGERGMSSAEYAALKQQPEVREYRQTLADSLKLARSYDGSEASYGKIMSSLELLEEIIETSPGIEGASLADKETVAALTFSPINPRDINDVLGLAGESQKRAVAHALETPEQSQLIVHKTNKIFLPTNPGAAPLTGEGKEGLKPPRFEERLQELVGMLQDMGVFLDDIAVTIGETSPSMMREVSYAFVDIPRLDRSVLVCDQVGEATFVIKGHLPESLLTSLDKDALLQTFPDRVRRILRKSPKQWSADLKEALTEEGWAREKVNLSARETDKQHFATLLRQKFTAQQWKEMTTDGAGALRVGGKGLDAIGGLFGVQGSPRSQAISRLEIGLMIWPEDNGLRGVYIAKQEELHARELPSAKLVELVRSQTNPETWKALDSIERRAFRVKDVGLVHIAKALNISGNPLSSTRAHLELGHQIWPEDELIGKALEIERRTTEEWRNAIREKMTADTWRALTSKTALLIEIDGLHLMAIAGIFGVEGNVHSKRKARLELGHKIWPEDKTIEKMLSAETRTQDDWRAEIRARMTPEQWFALNQYRRKALEIEDRGIKALGTIFEIEGNPVAQTEAFYELGRKIWPEAAALWDTPVTMGRRKA